VRPLWEVPQVCDIKVEDQARRASQ
jgi:hypothetical protein